VTLVNDGVGPALATKGLTAGTGISLVSSASSVTISNLDPASGVTLASAGGTSLVSGGAGPALATKGLTAGVGISLVPTVSSVIITATGGVVGTLTSWFLSEQTPTAVNGGTAVAGAVNLRKVNNIISDGGPSPGNVTLNAGTNRFTLQPGRYIVRGSAPVADVDLHRLSLYADVGNVLTISGSSEHCPSGGSANGGTVRSIVCGFLAPLAATAYYLGHYTVAGKAGFGLGLSVGQPGVVETYAELLVIQLA
jgi:hypothetical protein